MLKKYGKLWITIALIAIILFGIIWLTLINLEVGMAKEVGVQEPALPAYDRSAVPQNVIDDAVITANELVGKSKEKLQTMVDELLSSYVEAKNSDVVIFFNSGGWGWNSIQDSPGWISILDGIRAHLENLGYRSFVLNYQRTNRSLKGCVKEFFEAAASYPRKARDLSRRVAFLSDHLPVLKVIIAGESLGSVISDKTMDILEYNTNVYSIQTGTPFWYQPTEIDRKLLMNSNGRGIDTFSYGNLPAMVWATFKGWLGLASPEENPGDILNWLRAPGHDYSWEYPGISSAVIDFLNSNFDKKS
jgi:hypothetical protein